MSIIIRNRDTGDIFDIPSDFVLEINNTSPLFNNLGSKTVSTSIPRTNHNMRLLDYANRLDIDNKPKGKIPVTISYKSYIRQGMLYLSSAYNTTKSFGISIAFNEGIMYESMDDMLLTDLSNLPVIEMEFDALIEYMNKLYHEDGADEPLSVFPVRLKGEKYSREDSDAEYTSIVDLNAQSETEIDLMMRTTFDIVYDNKQQTVQVPSGFGITPFVRVWKILELIFDHFGYQIGENPFKEHFQLKRLCVLNNTIDAIVLGRIDYKQLLPAVTISEFLNSLYCRFGMKIFFDSNTNKVNLKLLKDILLSNDLFSLPVSSVLDIDMATPKQIKLSVAKNLDQSSTQTDTFEEFLSLYNNTIGNYIEFSSNYIGGIYLSERTNLFYQISQQAVKKIISSNNFDWNKKEKGYETEEITSVDEALIMDYDDKAPIPIYNVSARLINTILTVMGQNDNTLMTDENKLAFAYDMGEGYSKSEDNKNYFGFKYGSIFPYTVDSSGKPEYQEDRNGNVFQYSLLLIGENGAFNQFFKNYDAFLRHSNNIVKCSIHAPLHQLLSLGYSVKQYIDNQPLLLNTVDHQLGSSQSGEATIEARTIRLYKPYDLEKEQQLPVADPIKYKWILNEDRQKSIDDFIAAKIKEYKEREGYDPKYTFVHYQFVRITDDPNPPTDRDYWFLPPTLQQYQAQTSIGYNLHSFYVMFSYEYIYDSGRVQETPIESLTYHSWFIPDII